MRLFAVVVGSILLAPFATAVVPEGPGLVPEDVASDACGRHEVLVDGRAVGAHCARLDLDVGTPRCEPSSFLPDRYECRITFLFSASASAWTSAGSFVAPIDGTCGDSVDLHGAWTDGPDAVLGSGHTFTCVYGRFITAGSCFDWTESVRMTITGEDAPAPLEESASGRVCAPA